MKLFIANTTKQHHVFTYQMPEQGLRRRDIKAGTQVLIDGLTTDQASHIVKQYEIYNIQDITKMSRVKGFVGFSYSIDNPVPIEAMLAQFDANDQAMAGKAKERLVIEAAAVQDAIATDMQRQTGADKEQVRPRVEVETVEETGDGSRPSISQGVEVPRDANSEPKKSRK